MKRATYIKSLLLLLIAATAVIQESNAQNVLIDSIEYKVLDHKNEDTIKVNLLNKAAYQLRRVDLTKSLRYATEGLKLSEKLNFKKGKAESLNAIGNYNYLNSNYAKAHEYFQKSIEVSNEIVYEVGLAFSYNGIGMTYGRQGNYPIGLEFLQKALRINEKLGDQSRVSFTLYTIGTSYVLQENFQLALDYFNRSLILSKKLDERTFMSVALRDIGETQTNLGNYEEALEAFQDGMIIMEELRDSKGMSSSHINIGILYKELGDQALAADNFERAIQIAKANGFKHNLCNALTCMSAIYLDNGNHDKALTFSLDALEIAKELEILAEQKDIYQQLSKIYEAENNYRLAYESQQLYKELNDSIFSEESIRTIANLEYIYQYEKEKREASLQELKEEALRVSEIKWQKKIRNFFIIGFIAMGVLVILILKASRQRRKDNLVLETQKTLLYEQREELRDTISKLQKAQSQLVQSEKMASVGFLTAGIAHEMNNPLNFIHGGKSGLDKYVKKHLKEHQAQLKPILETIEIGIRRSTDLVASLNRFSRSSGNRTEECDIHVIIDNCLLILKNTIEGRIELVRDFTKSKFTLTGQEGELHQVFLNLLTNAVQSIENEGTISVKTEMLKNGLLVHIIDSGSGISAENLKKVTSPFFTTKDPGKGTGLGASISYNIVEAHNGTIDFTSEIGVGTTVIITLPIVH